ncbi:MAG: hypothetical protein LBS48_00455 [Treponema sp.]|nr:hypothetical protein [Treponema sp.]
MIEMKLIASGAQADVYYTDNRAIKLFKNTMPKGDVEYEIKLQKMAFEYGLPVPEIYESIEIDGKSGIVMEYINSMPIGNIILNEPNKANEYLGKSVDIQLAINSIITGKFPPMKDKLKRQISGAKGIDNETKDKIIEL